MASLNKLVNYEVNKPQAKEFFGYFIDSFGSEHKLIEGLRDKIKPGWEESLKRKIMKIFHQMRQFWNNSLFQNQFNKLERLMSIHSVKISQEMNILEIEQRMDPQLFKLLQTTSISSWI